MAMMNQRRKKNLLLAFVIAGFAIGLYLYAIYHVMSGTQSL
jgi:hypothetical protein